MIKYILRRLLQAIPVIFLITLVSFWLMLQAPGGPEAAFNQNPHINHAQIEAWLKAWCLEQNPDIFGIAREYLGWMGIWNCDTGSILSAQGLPNFLPTFLGGGTNGILHGDFGLSIEYNSPVLGVIMSRLPATLILMTTATIIWISVAIVAGVLAAVRRYSLFDNTVTLVSYILYALPTFWLGLMLIFAFGVTLRILPPQGIVDARAAPAPFATAAYWAAFAKNPLPNLLDIGSHLILPVATLVAVSVAGDSRFVRSAMLDSLNQDYVRTARAKGLPSSKVIFRHAFRNALLPILTNITLEIAFIFSGAIVTETVFSWPGMGLLYYEGVQGRDYFLLMGILLVGSVLVVAMNLVADVLYAVADPRIRYD
jgi:peptide/nickel transport system permease protein